MDTQKQTFWIDCLESIKNKISDQAFETWFSDVELIDLNKEEINLQVPNQYHYEWLEQKYRHLINDVIICWPIRPKHPVTAKFIFFIKK